MDRPLTVRIDEGILKRLKAHARETDAKIHRIVEDALRAALPTKKGRVA